MNNTAPNKKKSIWSVLVLVVLVFGIFAWEKFAVPVFLKIPDNFSYSADVVSKDNFFDEEKKVFKGESLSVTKFYYEVAEKKEGNLIVKNVFDVKAPTGEEIFAVERLYGVDPKTGRHTKGFGDRDRDGYLFAPRFTNKEPFTYWHINYDTPANLTYKGDENLFGLKVQKYESDYNADQTVNLGFLPDVGKSRVVKLDIRLALWIEPVSGHLVKYQDLTTAYYYDLKTSERQNPWNQFTNTYTEESLKNHVELARLEKMRVLVVEFGPPLLLLISALVFHLYPFVQKKKTKNPSSGIAVVIFVFIVLICLLATFGGYWFTQQNLQKELRAKFDTETLEIAESIENRVETYKNALLGLRGLFSASDQVERDEFSEYLKSINLFENYSGVRALAFLEYLKTDAELANHVRRVRGEGFADYNVLPTGVRQAYGPITFLEPFDSVTKRAFGYDTMSEPVRREAIEKALDTGASQITGKVSLRTQETVEPGFVMFLPVYQNGLPTSSVEERRRAILGLVNAGFWVSDFIKGTISEDSQRIKFTIYDGLVLSAESQIYSSSDQVKINSSKSQLAKTIIVYISGHPWTIKFESLAGFDVVGSQNWIPNLVLIVGLIFSAMIVLIFYFLSTSQSKAVSLASQVTSELDKEKHLLEAVISSMGEGLLVVGKDYNTQLINPAAENILGINKDQVLGKSWANFISAYEGEKEIVLENRNSVVVLKTGKTIVTKLEDNHYYKTADGRFFPVVSVTTPVKIGETIGSAVKLFRDATNEKKLENEMEVKIKELERLNKLMVDRELKMVELKKKLGKL